MRREGWWLRVGRQWGQGPRGVLLARRVALSGLNGAAGAGSAGRGCVWALPVLLALLLLRRLLPFSELLGRGLPIVLVLQTKEGNRPLR